MAIQLENLVARQDGQDENRIGWLFWFKVSDEHTQSDIIEQAFIDSGLPGKYKFPEIRSNDAFRRASKSVEGHVEADCKDEKIELLVRDVANNKDEIVRHLVVERRNVKDRRLDYDQCGAVLTYYHDTKSVMSSIMDYDDFIVDAVNKFEENFRFFLQSYDGQAKRRAVRNVLEDLAAASVKESGGVYLVPRQNEALLFQLIDFINGLPNCKAYKMPVENTGEARDMVRDVVTNKAEGMLSEIRNVLKERTEDDKLSEPAVLKLIEKAKQVKSEVLLYQSILKESIGTLETDVELLQAQMIALVEEL